MTTAGGRIGGAPDSPPAQTGRAADEAPVIVRCARPASTADPVRALLLHGLGNSGTSWDAWLPRADESLELWVAELPWRGESLNGWGIEGAVTARMAEAFALVDGPVHLAMAHSFSAAVLLDLVNRLTVDAPAEGSDIDLSVLSQLRAAVLVSPFYRARAEEFTWADISYYLNDFHKILAAGIKVRSAGRTDPERQREMALWVQDRIGPYGWVRFFESYLRTPELRLDRLDLPCLVIGGTDDIASFPRDSHGLAAALKTAQAHVFDNCGHFAMTERADDFAGLVNDFVRTYASRPSPGTPDQHTWEQTR